MMNTAPETFVRFPWRDRLLHITVMVSFSLLALTGLPQKFASQDWARVMVDLMGGIAVIRVVHRICAILLGCAFVFHLFEGLYGLIVKRQRFDMLPTRKDFVDLVHNLGYLVGLRQTKPRFERFSYIEKFDYWAVFWGMAIMATSGLILWFPTVTTRFLPGLSVAMAEAAHSDEALLAVSAIILWHLYNTHLKPQMFPLNASIFTGRLTRHEMMTEHAAEYERITGEKVPDEVLAERPPPSWGKLAASAVLGVATISLFVAMISWALRPPAPQLIAPQHMPLPRQRLIQPAPTSAMPAAAESAQLLAPERRAGVAAPVADFTVEVVEGTVRFADVSQGEVVVRRWDFGDGTASTAARPEHLFRRCPGPTNACTITLTVCGPGGCSSASRANLIALPES